MRTSVLQQFLSEPDTFKEKSLLLPNELYLGCSREGHKEFSTLLGNIFRFIKSFLSPSPSLSFSKELQVPAGIIKTKSFASELIEVSLSTALYNLAGSDSSSCLMNNCSNARARPSQGKMLISFR